MAYLFEIFVHYKHLFEILVVDLYKNTNANLINLSRNKAHLGFLKMCRKLYLTCNGVHVAAILYYLV